MRNVSNYERYILTRALYCRCDGPNALACALGMSPTTLRGRLSGLSEWTLDECRKLRVILNLDVVTWVMITLYHISPYDTGYDLMVDAVFAHTS